MQKQQHKPGFFERILSRRASREHEAFVKAILKDLYVNGRRTETINQQYSNTIEELPWDYQKLYDLYQHDPVVRTIGDSIIRELLRPRGASRTAYSVQPRWARKCPGCGAEFQNETEKCPDCRHSNGVSIATIKPSGGQRQKLKAFLEDPNRDDELTDLIESAYHYMFSVGDWYLSKQNNDVKTAIPLAIYNEDSRYMKVTPINEPRWVCPKDRQIQHVFAKETDICPEHPDTPLLKVAYEYTEHKKYFGREELLHGKPSAWLPSKYSFSPLITLLIIVYSMQAMNVNNLDIYDEGKLGNILCLPIEQSAADNLAQSVEKQRNVPKWDSNKGKWTVKRLRTLFLGVGRDAEAAVNVPAMPDSEKMQSLEWWKLWKTAACAIYGVQDIYAGAVEQGTTGQNPRMKVDVNNDTIEFWGSKFEDPFNNVVVKQWLGVTDWIFKFNPVEEKDEMQDITILSTKLDVMKKAISLGLKAELSDNGEVKVSGRPLSLEEQQAMQMERFQKMADNAKPADASFGDKQPFKKEAVFAKEKSESWLVTKVKKTND